MITSFFCTISLKKVYLEELVSVIFHTQFLF